MGDEQGAAASSSTSASQKKRQDDKHRRRDPKSWENVQKAVAGMDETAKMENIGEKYEEIYNELRTLNHKIQTLAKQKATLQKEKDHNQAEFAKSVMQRARLENLCRELQKQNKQIKDENMAKIKEEEERRKEVSLKFADKLTDINNMMDENKEKSDKLREENLKMTAKLADLYAQFQQRERDIGKMSEQLELERQYSQATLKKMELEIQAEKEMHAQEIAILKSNLEKSEANCNVLLETVKGLQDHVDVYKNQYEDFESTMSKSTKVFDNFKVEIANMTRQVNTLEQEAMSWKNKFHDSMKALVEVSELKRNQDVYLQTVDKKNEQLHKLCRQLQTERSHYLKLLKTHGIEPTVVSSPKEKPEDEPSTSATSKKSASPKMTKKEKELQILKDNLKAVQEELSRINVEETEKSQSKKTDDETSQLPKEDSAEGTESVSVTDKASVLPSSDDPSSKENLFLNTENNLNHHDQQDAQPTENDAKEC